LGIKEKRQENGEEEGNVFIGTKWWTIYSKKMKTTRRGIEDTIKENREECMLMGGNFNGKIGKRVQEEHEIGKRRKDREKYILPEEPVCQWRSGAIESKRKMDEYRADWKGQRHRQARKKGENQK
jgi:hypothetical protein